MAILRRALRVEHERASTKPLAARPSRERRSRSDSYRRRGDGRLRLRRATDVAMVEAADLGQATTRPCSGGSTARGSGASFSSARCAREPW